MVGMKKRDTRTPPQPSPVSLATSPRKSPAGSVSGDDKTAAASASADWRELARRIQQETDSGVMLDLVQQLITKLDEEKARKPSRKQK